jgi:hypothetical protein
MTAGAGKPNSTSTSLRLDRSRGLSPRRAYGTQRRARSLSRGKVGSTKRKTEVAAPHGQVPKSRLAAVYSELIQMKAACHFAGASLSRFALARHGTATNEAAGEQQNSGGGPLFGSLSKTVSSVD